MSDFLLELRSEEIPARMQAGARADLEKLFRKEMSAAGVAVGEVTVWSTPRRLALIARNLPEATAAVSEEVKGPRVGAPPQALEGFLRKTGLTEDQLTERDGVLFAISEKPGRATSEVLAEAIPAIVRAFPWPKSQRWGAASISTESMRWVRPLSGIVAIFGEALVACEVGGIASGYATRGHRFHCPGKITIGSVSDYQEKLRACHVIVDHADRQDLIRSRAKAAAEAAGLTLVEDEGLVIENAGLTEWPVPLLGRFDEEYLEVPPEVIQLTARTNQKYFVCESDGKLANAFVCTANIEATDGGAGIVAGNRKVLAARLSDARFFWQQDRKTKLAEQAKKLSRITFHEKLGAVADKVERVAKLAEWLASEGIVPNCDPALARQAAELCKADLVTEMVGEFPELQGLMGGYYARAEGLPDAVADAIAGHYKPVGQGDDVPTAPVTVAVALADKLDTIRSFFGIDERPTGSKDPFALRRAALGIIQIITTNGLRFGVAEGEVLAFFADRLKVQQKEAGVRHDLIDAVFALGGEDDLVRLLARVHALQAFVGTEDGTNLLSGYKRAANILKKEGVEAASDISLSYTPETAEKTLIDALDAAGPKASAAVAAEDFAGAMAALASLRGPIDAFFDQVTVNDADPAKRAYRLSLLAQLRDAVHGVADFSRIEG
ncbi:glycine--tRNA ligase subunit beta [Novosphingobium sp.]|uniref:glycine--tRNA ligase subunit beta n=1 Tax=Novosphingobium sp. TaxID=1874826 RepID=UPI00286D85EE|nr:glycine--tRNA ligase subunit beta [Novosphingobium sp.]